MEVYRDTLAPASMVGIAYQGTGFLFSGWMGGLVDKCSRLKFVRSIIAIQKVRMSFAPRSASGLIESAQYVSGCTIDKLCPVP